MCKRVNTSFHQRAHQKPIILTKLLCCESHHQWIMLGKLWSVHIENANLIFRKYNVPFSLTEIALVLCNIQWNNFHQMLPWPSKQLPLEMGKCYTRSLGVNAFRRQVSVVHGMWVNACQFLYCSNCGLNVHPSSLTFLDCVLPRIIPLNWNFLPFCICIYI